MPTDTLSSVSPITYVNSTGAAIEILLKKLITSLEGEPVADALIACVSMAIILQDPDVPLSKLQQTVKGATEWIALSLSGVDSGGIPTPTSQAN